MMAATGEELWRYSLRLYSDRSVNAACLRLQDELAADVNMILLLLFAATKGWQLSSLSITTLERECQSWRETVIEPLRRVRRLVKNDELRASCDVYQQVKAAELLAERRHQLALGAALERVVAGASTCPPHDAARLNLEAYPPLRTASQESIASLLSAHARHLSATIGQIYSPGVSPEPS